MRDAGRSFGNIASGRVRDVFMREKRFDAQALFAPNTTSVGTASSRIKRDVAARDNPRNAGRSGSVREAHLLLAR